MNHVEYKKNKCQPNHVWTYSDINTKGKIPSGLQCHCGQKISHYTLCDGCGAEKFDPIDIKVKDDDD